jgi:hypothetical protein
MQINSFWIVRPANCLAAHPAYPTSQQLPAKLPRHSTLCYFTFQQDTRVLLLSSITEDWHNCTGNRCGIPQVMTAAHDQPDNAACVEKLGIGSVLSPNKSNAATLAENKNIDHVKGCFRPLQSLCSKNRSRSIAV